MKKWLLILFFVLPGFAALAQQDEPQGPEASKIGERMREYVQDRLGLSRKEAERFSPVFMRYFREFAITHRQFKDDKLVMQQKIVELRLRYRTEFRQVLDEQRANKVFVIEDNFRKEVLAAIKENRENRRENGGGGRRFR